VNRTALHVGAAILVTLLCAAPVVAEAAGEGVRVLSGFEWEDFDGKLGRWLYRGRPMLERPDVGWKGVKIEKAEAVGPNGFQIINGAPSSSRHMPGTLCVPKFATQGRFAFRSLMFGETAQARSRTRYLERGLKQKHPPPWPVHEPGYDVHDHWFQREYQVYRQEWKQTTDWRGYERLRFDVTAVGQPIKLGMRVRDGSGPRINPGPTGLRTAVAIWTVPADETVTCEFPLAEMAKVGELDLGRIHRYNIRVNGLPTGTAPKGLFLDNVRLVARGAEPKPQHKLIVPETRVRPFARPVYVRPPTRRNAERLKRELGPVEPLGPVVINKAALYAGRLGHGAGHFGRSGATYMSNSRRACVAYDNKRLLVIIGGRSAPRGSRKDRAARGGTIALASFDGGATWGGVRPGDKDFTILPWYLRSGFSADRYGNAYAVGTPNCDSYREGQDICLHRLAFTGDRWVDDRFAILHQDGYKCPAFCHAIAVGSGRIWAAWHDGFGGDLARFSDDDGFTFKPCKDASLPPPRPFHEPKLEDLGTPAAVDPPKQVLLWPTQTVPGSFLVPYRGQVAVFTRDGARWAAHDGVKWGPTRKAVRLGRMTTFTCLGEEHLFMARGAAYNDLGRELLADLVVAHLQDGGWKKQQLEAANVGSAIVTASGEAVYCFYVLKRGEGEAAVYEVRYRRWVGGRWGESVKIAEQRRRINHLAAPQICPPSYAAVFWDQHFRKRDDPSEVKFVRVPNR
jgi:hypothetical protein